MRKVYFVRHAQADNSIKDDMTRPLTEKGQKDCLKLVDFLKNRNIEHSFSSPYKRAIDTIKPFSSANNLEINIVEGFRERKIGDSLIDDFKDFSQKQWENFDYKLENGESLGETQDRNISALMDILQNYTGNIVIAGHGTALSTVVHYFDNSFGYDEFEKIVDVMPWVVMLSFEKNKIQKIETHSFE